ncbi:tetratricopeptide repeat protein [Legionella brunensis]|uniref:Tetratricopeptide repeat protein n=1 Tax=Legionella brunensis TaxID=29422 RepID=A0A0W0SCV7_9GAMM|nr:tetratricopeptide repeat protein [Legionella brunensis]KTC81358.1 Tetratricopeptide repeat protein [Legionella brunensis]
MRIRNIVVLVMIFFSSIHFSFAKIQQTKLEAPLFDDLGSIDFPISTQVPLAQRFFDQGLILYYGFEWGEAIRSFKAATKLDPHCGMCYWGLALALSSKMNAPMSGLEYKEAREAIHKAVTLKDYETPTEQAYINALALRFKHPPKEQIPEMLSAFSCHDASSSSDKSSPEEIAAYTTAMKALIKNYPLDNHAKALYAWALFETIEWKFWDIDGKINPVTPQIIAVLKEALAKDKRHIGANHYYIHVIETSPYPEKALDNANLLTTLVPGSEHLVHMPTHIYMLTGLYHEGSNSNLQAIAAFNNYNKTCRAQGFEPEINYLYLHNYDFLRTTATMEGRKALALSAASSLVDNPFPDWLANESSLQWFIPVPYYVKARFAMWKELLNEKKPLDEYQYAQGMWHYARGMAFVHLNDQIAANKELHALDKIIQAGPNNQNLQENGITLLKIAQAVLQANIANAKKDKGATLSYLQVAMKLQQNMRYHEPPDWYFPVKEMLADAYLKWGQPKKAVTLYEQALKQYPKNGWALFGLTKSLRQLGNTSKAEQTEKAFHAAWKYADIPTPVSLLGN